MQQMLKKITKKSFFQYVRYKKKVREIISPLIREDGKKVTGSRKEK